MAPIIEMLLQIPSLRVLWGRNDFKDIKLSIMDKFFEVLPSELIVNKSEQYHWYDIAQDGGNRSRIYFNGLKDLSGFSSQEFGVIAVTEAYEMTEQAYRTLKRRIRQENVPVMILMEGEAPNEDHWLAKLTDPNDKSYDKDIEQWKVSTYENWDNLPDAYKDSLESMPESWKKKYLLGEYGFIPDGDPFYQGFKELLHKREITTIVGKDLLLGWDYGFRHPACVITQLDSKGRWLVLRELIGTNITIDQFADAVKQYLNVEFNNCSFRSYGDPAGEQVNDKSEKTSEQIIHSKGFPVTSCASTYRDRKEIIEGKLSTLIDGVPALTINTPCKTIIDGFLGGYHYPMIKQGMQFTAVKTEQPYKDGYYEHCLSGETKIRTLNGWHKIKDLVGIENIITYAYDNFGKRLIPVETRAIRKTQVNVELWKLLFDNGELIATPDHLIMLRDGSYRQLKDLVPNDELMPFYEKQRGKQGHKIIHLNDGSVVDEHRYIYNWFCRNLRAGHHIHHKDSNPTNNYPGNLQQLDAQEHMQAVYEKMRKHPTVKSMRNGSLNPWTKESRDKMSRYMSARYEDGNHPLTKRIDKICPICNQVYAATHRQKYCSNCKNRQRSYREKLQLSNMINHKVESVGFYGFGDTYNLEVDTYNNFVANGLLVHNCMNALEYIAVNIFKPVKRSTRGDSKRRARRYALANRKNAGYGWNG